MVYTHLSPTPATPQNRYGLYSPFLPHQPQPTPHRRWPSLHLRHHNNRHKEYVRVTKPASKYGASTGGTPMPMADIAIRRGRRLEEQSTVMVYTRQRYYGHHRHQHQYRLYVETPTGADTNYAAIFAGGNVGIDDESRVYTRRKWNNQITEWTNQLPMLIYLVFWYTWWLFL